MPGPILDLGAIVTCSHGGKATPVPVDARVLLSGKPAVTQASIYAVAGCGFVPPGGNGPCVTGTVVVAAARVFASGVPVALQTSVTTCAPTGTPLIPIQTQTRVIGS